jgi:hypothetical protein
MKKQPKDMQNHCHISMRTTNLQTGEQRQLSQVEVALRLQQVLSIPPHERIRQSLRGISSEEQ